MPSYVTRVTYCINPKSWEMIYCTGNDSIDSHSLAFRITGSLGGKPPVMRLFDVCFGIRLSKRLKDPQMIMSCRTFIGLNWSTRVVLPSVYRYVCRATNVLVAHFHRTSTVHLFARSRTKASILLDRIHCGIIVGDCRIFSGWGITFLMPWTQTL